jgi:hypothetical protein
MKNNSYDFFRNATITKIDVKRYSEKKYSSIADIIPMIVIDESPSHVTINNDHHTLLHHYDGQNLNIITNYYDF